MIAISVAIIGPIRSIFVRLMQQWRFNRDRRITRTKGQVVIIFQLLMEIDFVRRAWSFLAKRIEKESSVTLCSHSQRIIFLKLIYKKTDNKLFLKLL